MNTDNSYKYGYKWAFAYAGLFAVLAPIFSSPKEIFEGFFEILLADNMLITDYFSLAGFGAALTNVSIVTFITLALMYKCHIPLNGTGILTIGLMSGFSFFGKSVFNMWFILLGTWLYARWSKQPFSKFLLISLFSTSLSPLISHLFFYQKTLYLPNMLLSLFCGVLIGFVMPMMGPYAAYLLNEMTLYTSGFSVGLLCLVIVPILKSYGYLFNPVTVWTSGNNIPIGLMLGVFCCFLIYMGWRKEGMQAVRNYFNLLKRSGVSSQDFTDLDGMGAVLINMGVNGLIGTLYIILIKGHLNGPTIGGILTIIGFSAKGKHAANILPIMIGVALGGITKQWSPSSPPAQLAALFGTTLAPISGAFGPIAGVIAGFIHSSVVQHAGMGYSGINLYNNGFAGGIVSIVVYPVFVRIFRFNRYADPSPGSPAAVRQQLEAIKAQEALNAQIFRHAHDVEVELEHELEETIHPKHSTEEGD
ncbi:MAG: DUF1576 domain-containing protein [Clostridia bacterium]|nr:DUF1576 domain-containing protein [Clostridia bacterium]MBQ3092344.1 DUF1576 domain-containing protein [Clostridia bacterium]